jgi:4-hydroxybenzoate polyprenyltransferase
MYLLARALRLHYWTKNLLIFVPAFFASRLDPSVAASLLIAWLAFGCAASAHYLFNDFADRHHDRSDRFKSRRPQATGELQPRHALALGFFLFCSAMLCSLALPTPFKVTLGSYLLFCFVYSLQLKHLLVLDVFALVVLHDLRLVAGTAAISLPLSAGLLASASLVFTALALLKRIAQFDSSSVNSAGSLQGGAYTENHQPFLRVAAGIACGISGLALSMFVLEVAGTMTRPAALWLVPPLVGVGLGRYFFLVIRKTANQDLVSFAFTDRISAVVLASLALTSIFAR